MDQSTAQIILPISGYVVTIRNRLSYKAKNEIEAVIKAGTKGVTVNGQMQETIEGASVQGFLQKMVEVFVVNTKNDKDQEIQLVLEMQSDDFDSEDGEFLELEVLKIWNGIKKKLTPKT